MRLLFTCDGPRPLAGRPHQHLRGLTLPEVVISGAIVAIVFGGTLNAYVQTGQRVEWTSYSLAAQALAQQTIEQAKAGVWDPTIPENEVTNLNVLPASITYSSTANSSTWSGYSVGVLGVPYSGTNVVYATNYVQVQMLEVNSTANVWEQVVRVDCVWPFYSHSSGLEYCTNTVCTIQAPDNRDPSTF